MSFGYTDHPAANLVPVHGICKDEFAEVGKTFAENLNSGRDLGGSVCMFVEGECVVDLWGGYFDMNFSRQWERNTIAQMFSSTKTLTALCALVLADRGALDLDAPVAKYWPEFAANGKSQILVRQLLNYQSGVAGWDEPMTIRGICDVEKSTAMLARQAPWWQPGTAHGYHGFTIGHLVGEVVRRITGKSLGTFLREEIAEPLGVGDDVHIGTAEKYDPFVSPLTPGRPGDHGFGDKSYYDRALFNPRVGPQDTANAFWRRAEMGGINGHGNARGLATVQQVLANGGAFGKRLMSEAGRRPAAELQMDALDLVLGLPMKWGLTYCVDTGYADVPGSTVAWWAGNGGSLSYVDLDARMSLGYVPNRWISGTYELERGRRLAKAAYASLGAAVK